MSEVLVVFLVLRKRLLPKWPAKIVGVSCDWFEWPLLKCGELSRLDHFNIPIAWRIVIFLIFYAAVGAVIGWCAGKVWQLARKKKQCTTEEMNIEH